MKDQCEGMIVFVVEGPASDFLDLIFLDESPPMQAPAPVDEEVKIKFCSLVEEDM